MAGFKDEITRDDGFSCRVSNEIFKRHKGFKDTTPEELADYLRTTDKANWKTEGNLRKARSTKFDLPSNFDEVLLPKEKGMWAEKRDSQYLYLNGFWCSSVDSSTGKYPIWTLNVLVGNKYKADAADIRKELVDAYGVENYEHWKQTVKADTKGLHAVLDALADWCGRKKKVAISYTSSPSSERLLKSCGIRVEREWAFIYPHYKGHWGPRENN